MIFFYSDKQTQISYVKSAVILRIKKLISQQRYSYNWTGMSRITST